MDPSRNTIFRDGEAIRVTPKMMQVLVCLAEHAGETVSKEVLFQTVWADTFVTDDVLKGSISELRRILEDDAHESHIIQTIPKRGYRLVAAPQPANGQSVGVKAVHPEAAPPAVASPHAPLTLTSTLGRRTVASLVDTITEYRRAKRIWMIAAGVFAVIGLALIFALLAVLNVDGLSRSVLGMSATPSIHSIAVLPLQNLSSDPAQEYFSDGMTDALVTDLAQIGSLRVISRTSTIRYKKSPKSLPQIARELNVDGIVEGTVQRSGDRIRITAQLIEASSDRHVWARSYDGNLQDALYVQSEIARSIAQQIRVKLTPNEEKLLARAQPVNLNAVEPFLLGRSHYQDARNRMYNSGDPAGREAEVQKAMTEFQRAIAADPNYAPAYVAMAATLIARGSLSPSEDLTVREDIRKALAIDPGLAEAYLVLGRQDLFDWKFDDAGHDYQRALELNPNLAEAHVYYSEYLDLVGRSDEGLREAELAKKLDPTTDQLAWEYYARRQFDRFIELKRNDVDTHMFGPMAHYDLGYGYERAGRYEDAIREWEEAMKGFGFEDQAEALRRGYAAHGFKGAIREWVGILERLSARGQAVHPELPAYLYAILGDKDRAFSWLEKAYQQKTHGMPFLKLDPTFDNIRSDPRYTDLERRVGLLP